MEIKVHNSQEKTSPETYLHLMIRCHSGKNCRLMKHREVPLCRIIFLIIYASSVQKFYEVAGVLFLFLRVYALKCRYPAPEKSNRRSVVMRKYRFSDAISKHKFLGCTQLALRICGNNAKPPILTDCLADAL